jgi:DNA polymerase III alpha subunit (gram-positive type)
MDAAITGPVTKDGPVTPAVYIVTDIEADGGTPGVHSMIAFASVAVREDGVMLGEFEAVLAPLDGATQDPRTMAWWAGRPDAWAAASTNPKPPQQVMQEFTAWVRQYPNAIFAAHPLNFDGMWVNYYLRRFTAHGVTEGMHETDRLFRHIGLCLRSFGAALLGRPVLDVEADAYPPDWLGNHAHTHRAIDDARGYASLLVKLFQISKERAS